MDYSNKWTKKSIVIVRDCCGGLRSTHQLLEQHQLKKTTRLLNTQKHTKCPPSLLYNNAVYTSKPFTVHSVCRPTLHSHALSGEIRLRLRRVTKGCTGRPASMCLYYVCNVLHICKAYTIAHAYFSYVTLACVLCVRNCANAQTDCWTLFTVVLFTIYESVYDASMMPQPNPLSQLPSNEATQRQYVSTLTRWKSVRRWGVQMRELQHAQNFHKNNTCSCSLCTLAKRSNGLREVTLFGLACTHVQSVLSECSWLQIQVKRTHTHPCVA